MLMGSAQKQIEFSGVAFYHKQGHFNVETKQVCGGIEGSRGGGKNGGEKSHPESLQTGKKSGDIKP